MLKDYELCYENANMQPDLEALRYMLAKAYVPYQMYTMKYPLDKALMVGTLFPELVKPWPPYYYEEVVKK